MRKLSFDKLTKGEGGREKKEKAVGSNEVKKDYFKNEILTLIRAEMWKILISSTLKDEEGELLLAGCI